MGSKPLRATHQTPRGLTPEHEINTWATGADYFVAGIDLAWGEKRADGVCVIRGRRDAATVIAFDYPFGDEALVDAIANDVAREAPALLAIDAPIICPNVTGSRPVDRLTHSLFHRQHAVCYPANATRCPRPRRILGKLRTLGFEAGYMLAPGARLAAEVYPHPAMVRLLPLKQIVKYKRGPVAERRSEFARLQRRLIRLVARAFPFLALGEETRRLLAAPWSKSVEDRTDAFFCALIGLWHVHYWGRFSEVIGDLETGFILLPVDFRTVRATALANLSKHG